MAPGARPDTMWRNKKIEVIIKQSSDESKPSWLEPQLELKYFRLSLAQLGLVWDLFRSARFFFSSKIGNLAFMDFYSYDPIKHCVMEGDWAPLCHEIEVTVIAFQG